MKLILVLTALLSAQTLVSLLGKVCPVPITTISGMWMDKTGIMVYPGSNKLLLHVQLSNDMISACQTPVDRIIGPLTGTFWYPKSEVRRDFYSFHKDSTTMIGYASMLDDPLVGEITSLPNRIKADSVKFGHDIVMYIKGDTVSYISGDKFYCPDRKVSGAMFASSYASAYDKNSFVCLTMYDSSYYWTFENYKPIRHSFKSKDIAGQISYMRDTGDIWFKGYLGGVYYHMSVGDTNRIPRAINPPRYGAGNINWMTWFKGKHYAIYDTTIWCTSDTGRTWSKYLQCSKTRWPYMMLSNGDSILYCLATTNGRSAIYDITTIVPPVTKAEVAAYRSTAIVSRQLYDVLGRKVSSNHQGRYLAPGRKFIKQ